jgi:outer membrane protein OmpA-like peptidoglycan-associated protein
MGRADCIGQKYVKMGYIFAMRFRRRLLPRIFGLLALAAVSLRADPGDVESSHDYPGFPRWPGFVISDYDEDSPASFNFPAAQPLPDDADHVIAIPVKGHRYVIRYEAGAGAHAPTLFQTQQYYEKLASDGGFTVVKSGAVGDVSETFFKATDSHQIWVYLVPSVNSNVVTVVESTGGVVPPAAQPPPPRLAMTPAVLPAPPPMPMPAPVPTAPTVTPTAPDSTPGPTPVPDIASAPTPAPSSDGAAPHYDTDDDSLFTELNSSGRVIIPFVFKPGKDELDASSQPLIDRVVAMMNRHPELFLRIEGHTDNSGDPDDNMRLSAQRALAVQAKLVAAHVDKKRLDAVGVGGLQPLASNITAEGREKNRRIELVVWKKYPAFHAPAPNGNNYYPGGASANTPSRAGL